jgi:hypothetical protein
MYAYRTISDVAVVIALEAIQTIWFTLAMFFDAKKFA